MEVRRHSFKNHYLQLIKNERGRDFLANLPAIAFWELARFGFALLRDRAVLAVEAKAPVHDISPTVRNRTVSSKTSS